ncbi:Phosphoenolpyruvate carboxylase kinase 2 [Cytospora mali]|nr:Phosphoenolpyruvate carboxylase kinase 2 [Valsa mali]
MEFIPTTLQDLIDQNWDYWVAKLADFRESEYIKAYSAAFVGTSWFIAPEILQEPRRCDEKADMFSLGIILIILLAGSSCWSDRTSEYVGQWSSDRQAEFIRQAVYPLIQQFGGDLSPLLCGLICRRVSNRWSASKALDWLTGHLEEQAGLSERGKRKRESQLPISTHARSPSTDSDATTLRLSTSSAHNSLVRWQPLKKRRDADEETDDTFFTAKETLSEVHTPSEIASTELVLGHDLHYGIRSSETRMMDILANPHAFRHEFFGFEDEHFWGTGTGPEHNGFLPRGQSGGQMVEACNCSMPDTLSWDNRVPPASLHTSAGASGPDSLPDTLFWDNRVLPASLHTSASVYRPPVASATTPFDDESADDYNDDSCERNEYKEGLAFDSTDWLDPESEEWLDREGKKG